MNVLDEDIDAIQREKLRARRIHFRQIGREVGRFGMKDLNDIIPLLHTVKRPTFFTRDHGFYSAKLRHAEYCLVYLDVPFDEVANYIRKLLRHPHFRADSERMGRVVRVRGGGLSYWEVDDEAEHVIAW